MSDFFAIALGNSTAAVALVADGTTLGGAQRTCVDCLDPFRELLARRPARGATLRRCPWPWRPSTRRP